MYLMGDTTMMHIRVDSELKSEATEAFKKMGLNPSEAVRVFLTRVVAEQAMPFDVKVPNAKTQAAIQELREARTPARSKAAGTRRASARPSNAR